MDLLLVKVVSKLLLPPAGNLLGAFAGLLLARRSPRAGHALVWLALLSLLLMSLPGVTEPFARASEPYPPLDVDAALHGGAGAIVLLGGGRYQGAPEYGGDTLSDESLVRARYAARLHRRTGLPILVTGGVIRSEGPAEADLIADVLESEFSVAVRWRERHARNTAENASLSAALLRAADVDAVLLVTHARHMKRSVARFEAAGLTVWPAPTRYESSAHRDYSPSISSWLPNVGALQESRQVLYELLGRVWYALRY